MATKKTYQQSLTNEDIKEKLKNYKKVIDIKHVSIGTHIRYFSKKQFRLGGTLHKIDPEGRYIMLNNGKITWSVQLANSEFFQLMNEAEIKDELKKEILTEINETTVENKEIKLLKKEIESLLKKNEEIKLLKKEIESLLKKNELLNNQLKKIGNEIKKEKNK